MTDAELRDAFDHANDFLAEDPEKHNLTILERSLCHSVVAMCKEISAQRKIMTECRDAIATTPLIRSSKFVFDKLDAALEGSK